MDSDPRCFPLIEVAFDRIGALLSPVLEGAEIAEIRRVEGGLVNTLYRITLADRGGALCLRVFAAGRPAWEAERNILAQVSASLPVPEALLAGEGGPGFAHPYLVYRWIEGMTLDECRRQTQPAAFLSLAEPLGRLLAGVAGFSFADARNRGPNADHKSPSSVVALLQFSEESLRRGLARLRLGDALADALWRLLEAGALRLGALDCATCLVHGDLGGRNILVAPIGNGHWRVSGLIDWEEAFSGAALWDVGRLFRYGGRYSDTFRQRFARSYLVAGGTLPEDWRRTARLLDATRLVELLSGERELPVVFAECRALVEGVVADWH
jgi:aminoglycoside phosphotransferase (APT) family kinase protein